MKLIVIALALFAAIGTADAKVKTQAALCKQGTTVLEGYLAYDDAATGKRSGVLVVHAWMGIDGNAKQREGLRLRCERRRALVVGDEVVLRRGVQELVS